MKYLNKFFAFSNNQVETTSSVTLRPSATLASTLYTVTFIAKPQHNSKLTKANRHQHLDDEQEEEHAYGTSDDDDEHDPREFKRSQSQSLIGNFDDHCNQLITINAINSSDDSIEFEKNPPVNKRKTHSSNDSTKQQEQLSDSTKSNENINTLETSRNCASIVGSLGNYILTATIGKTTANTSSVITSPDNIGKEKEENKSDQKPTNFAVDPQQPILLTEDDDDWILVDSNLLSASTCSASFTSNTAQLDNNNRSSSSQSPTTNPGYKHNKPSARVVENKYNKRIIKLNKKSIIKQMALDKTDVELIKASWIPAKKDPVFSGVLLFKGLFTKFPEYIKFFPQFSDLDIENMRENKRLIRHAVKVIETVTFVVDAIGNDSMTEQLNQALHNLVTSHLKRNIGLNEFRNLGIVLIDFICDINNRRQQQQKQVNELCQLNKSSTGDSINHSSNDDSETMTSTLDKVRASSSPSSSSEDDSYLVGGASRGMNNVSTNDTTNAGFNRQQQQQQQDADLEANNDVDSGSTTKIDTNVLVAAWTKLYSSILDLVEHEEAQ